MGLKVLSLFDGISCGRVALERTGIEIDKYYASEIANDAMCVTQSNYLSTIQLGNVNNYEEWFIDEIDLLIGGSPCQGFSTLGKMKGLKDERSGLFYKYVECFKKFSPNYFLLENNSDMPTQAKDEISELLGVDPIEIDSLLVSAQSRKRLYWTNIPGITQPTPKNIDLLDVIKQQRDNIQLVPSVLSKLPELEKKYGYIPRLFNPYNLKKIVNKSPCLTAQGNSQTKSSSVIIKLEDGYGMLDADEWEILQTLPLGYTKCLPSESKRKTVIGNGWTVDVIAHILSFIPISIK